MRYEIVLSANQTFDAVYEV